MKIIESPREGMQSLPFTIPTEQKVELINLLLRAGFDTVETGSNASPKFVPQMEDTVEVIRKLDLSGERSKIMALALNRKGVELFSGMEQVDYISYPYSISPVFLKKNLNVTMEQSFSDICSIVDSCQKTDKQAVVYISMSFGNPYGDPWNLDLLLNEIRKLVSTGVRIIPLSNVSIKVDPKLISTVFTEAIKEFPDIEFGLHFHTDGKDQGKVVDAAYDAGVRRFDTVLHGVGGCPMEGGKMLGNIDTNYLLRHFEKKNIEFPVNKEVFERANRMTTDLFLPSGDFKFVVRDRGI
jgi:hydroxymethylglutaryl-CoA lyase